MPKEITIRPTGVRDMTKIDALLSESYRSLLKADYPPSVLVTVLPIITRSNPSLLRSGSYYMAEDCDGLALAAGGWTQAAPQGRAGPSHVGHIRHVATHPKALRKGLARALIDISLKAARKSGVSLMMCQSTRTAVPFYSALGFEARGEITIALRPGIHFPAVEMACKL